MSLIAYIISMLVIGLLLGGLARLALPGKDPMSLMQTIAIGVTGAVVGGLISLALFGRDGGGLFIPFLVAFGLVYAVRRSRGGGLSSPGHQDAINR